MVFLERLEGQVSEMDRLKIVRLFHTLRIAEVLYRFEFVKWLYKRLFVASFPKSQYYLELSNRCNVECIFCTYPLLRDGGKQLVNMTQDNFEKILYLVHFLRLLDHTLFLNRIQIGTPHFPDKFELILAL